MNKKNNIIWIDKSANYIPWIITAGCIFLGMIALLEGKSPDFYNQD